MKEAEPISAIEQGDTVVTEYVVYNANRAFQRVQREKKGEGCGCSTCANDCVDELNSWVVFIWKRSIEGTQYEHWVDNGIIYQFGDEEK